MYEITFPFCPPWCDLKLEVNLDHGGRAYVFDTFCKNQSPAEKEERDAKILEIYEKAEIKKRIEAQSAKK